MSVAAQPALSPREIDDHMREIVTAVDRLSAPNADLGHFVVVAERFRRLRGQYQAHPHTLKAHTSNLAQLRQRFDALLDARLAAVVDRYHQVVEQIHAAETEKEVLRDVLVRHASDRRASLTGMRAEVSIRTSQSRSLPAAGTENRKQLESVVQQSGLWTDVSQLARAKLQHAIEANRFLPAHQQVISRLCPVTTTHHVVSRLQEGVPR